MVTAQALYTIRGEWSFAKDDLPLSFNPALLLSTQELERWKNKIYETIRYVQAANRAYDEL